MRILWLCNIMLPRIAEVLGKEASNKEGWLTGLADRILQMPASRLELGVCFPVGKEEKLVSGKDRGLFYFSFHEDLLQAHHYDVQTEQELGQIVQQFGPDVIHIFGTEYPHTLAMLKAAPDPSRVLVGIQGLVFEYTKYYMADLPPEVIGRANFRDIVRQDTLKRQQEKYEARGRFEKEALRLAVHVTGRTDWDYERTGSINPNRIYHFMGETLRSPFYSGEWDRKTCQPHRIFVSQGNYPIKGLHYVFPALAALAAEFPDVCLCVAGDNITAHGSFMEKLKLSSYGRHLLELIQQYGLEGRVEFLGRLDAEEMKAQYLKCNVFLSPSAIENSPNSIGEALILGVPVVSSACGGVMSLLTNEEEGLLYETADTAALTGCLRRVFSEIGLADRLHAAARRRGFALHNPEKNYHTLLGIYEELAGADPLVRQMVSGGQEPEKLRRQQAQEAPITVTFVSNYINHHQIPLSDAMYRRLGEGYHFIQTEPMEEERVRMGWGIRLEDIPYLKLFYKEPETCRRLIAESDIVVFGGTEREELIAPRLEAGRPVVRYSERLYREGQWKCVSPRGLRKKYKDHVRYRNAPVYLLCSGAYVASDFHLIHAYPDKMLKWGYFPEKKRFDMKALPNTGSGENGLHLLWAGRFLPLKHPEYAVYAAERLRKEGVAFTMEMIGDGEARPEVEKRIREKKLEDVVTLRGFLNPEEVRARMEQSQIFLFTSGHLEGWGAVLNEAMNSGCAVVACCAAGAVPFLIRHGCNGLVYREGDVGGFLEQVTELARDARLRARLGYRAYETIDTLWNAPNAADCLLRLCRGILSGSVSFEREGPCSPAQILAPRQGYASMMAERDRFLESQEETE